MSRRRPSRKSFLLWGCLLGRPGEAGKLATDTEQARVAPTVAADIPTDK